MVIVVQYCSECGNEIEETDKFCKSCGKQLSVKKIEVKKVDHKVIPYAEKASHQLIQPRLFWAIVIIIVVAFLSGIYLFTPETKSLSFSVPYQDPVYRTDSYQDPVYRTDSYQDPVYGTLYSGTIGNNGLTGKTWTITDATSYKSTYTGQGFWGAEYTLQICWSSSCSNYYKIQFNNLKSETKITGYGTKTRQVIDHYETKYRTEWKDVTKTRWEWFYYYDIENNK